MAAMRATLEHVLTDEAFVDMIALCDVYTRDVQEILDKYDLPWSISQIGARAEYRFVRPAPTNGTKACEAADDELDEYMHLYMCNRGVLMTPFHNMALMCPDTSIEDVKAHTALFELAVQQLMNHSS